MKVEVTEEKTYLEIVDEATTQVEVQPEAQELVSPESETTLNVETQEQAPNILEITETPTVVEVIDQVISVVEEAAGPKGDKGDPGAPAEYLVDDYPAGEALGGQRVVMLAADGELYYADQSNPTHFNRVLGITTGAVVEGANPIVRCGGVMTEPTWAWDLDKFLYLSVNGLLTQVPPAAGFLLQMGWPINATTIMVDIKEPILLT